MVPPFRFYFHWAPRLQHLEQNRCDVEDTTCFCYNLLIGNLIYKAQISVCVYVCSRFTPKWAENQQCFINGNSLEGREVSQVLNKRYQLRT